MERKGLYGDEADVFATSRGMSTSYGVYCAS